MDKSKLWKIGTVVLTSRFLFGYFLADIYLFRVSNGNSGTIFEICSELTIKKAERHQWRHSGVFIVSFEHISYIAMMLPLLALSK